jgi:hypothetical protein
VVTLTDDIMPAVISTLPTNLAIAMTTTGSTIITFNQTVSATAIAFAMECPNGAPVPLSVVPALPGSASVFNLLPQISLGQSLTCRVTVSASQIMQAVGGSGQTMAADYVFTFHTPGSFDGLKNGNETDTDCGGGAWHRLCVSRLRDQRGRDRVYRVTHLHDQ